MKRALVAVLVLVGLVGLVGCKRSVCDLDDRKVGPISATWQAHRDLVAPSATVCGSFGEPSLVVDFADDPNPAVRIVEHLESKGYTRVKQELGKPELQFYWLTKGDSEVGVTAHREGGRVWAEMKLQKL